MMFQVCIMGGHDGRLRPEKKIYLTLFGGMELTRPTVARQILAFRKKSPDEVYRTSRQFFLTICGGVDINSPTLAEEFIDFRELINSGELTLNDWENCMADVARFESSIGSLTLMGGFSEIGLPTEKEEIDKLAVQQYLGNIPEKSVEILKFGIGQRDSERRATLKRALMAGA